MATYRQRHRLEDPLKELPVQPRQPTQERLWPFRDSLVPGRGWVKNIPPRRPSNAGST